MSYLSSFTGLMSQHHLIVPVVKRKSIWMTPKMSLIADVVECINLLQGWRSKRTRKFMSLEAIDTLLNNRGVILSVVAEHFILSKAKLNELEITHEPKHSCNEMITHGLWRFCLHDETVYLWK